MSAHCKLGTSENTRRLLTNRLSVHTRIAGDGPPLLFLGGSNFDLTIRAPIFDSDLCKHFTVIAADNRGIGLTDAPDGSWTMADYALDALALLNALELNCVHVLGESFGAMTALEIATREPHRISYMALAAGAPGGENHRSYPIEQFLDLDSASERATRALRVLDRRFEDIEKRNPELSAQKIQMRMDSEARFLSHANNRSGYPRLLQARSGHDCLDKLAAIRIPTIVFAGQFDGQAPLALSQTLSTTMPDASLITIDAGHDLCFSHPDPVKILIERWNSA